MTMNEVVINKKPVLMIAVGITLALLGSDCD